MRYKFNEDVNPDVQAEWEEFLAKIIPTFQRIQDFCEIGTEDNINVIKKRLLEYETFGNFLSYHYADAMRFYKIALAHEWSVEPEFKGIFERNARAQVEARCIEPEAVLERFERLIKGLATALTALQTNARIEEALLSKRMD